MWGALTPLGRVMTCYFPPSFGVYLLGFIHRKELCLISTCSLVFQENPVKYLNMTSLYPHFSAYRVGSLSFSKVSLRLGGS